MARRATFILSLVVAAAAASSARAAVTITSFSAETASTLAGGHPDATTSFSLLRTFAGGEGEPVSTAGGVPRELEFRLPPGFIANPRATPQCPVTTFKAQGCPPSTQVGAGTITFSSTFGSGTAVMQVYNLAPAANAPALFGLDANITLAVLQELTAAVHAGDGYAVTVSAPELIRGFGGVLLGSSLTLWGVPADASHDGQRACRQFSQGTLELGCASESPPVPFIENPTDCAATPLTTLSVNTYQQPEVFASATASSPAPSDCGHVPFAPSIALMPETTRAGAPTGLTVDLSVPQSDAPNGRGSAELKRAVVTLPEGMTISPSAASHGLQACTDAQLGAGSDAPANCPAASVIGRTRVETPLLPGPLTGRVFLGQPLDTDPASGRMFRVFQELKGFGLDVKVAGSVVANPATGQLTATFADLPELPFETFKLHLNGGANAVLVNPPGCGANSTTTQLYPYSGNPPATPSSTFTTSYDGNGASCPQALPFTPSAAISTASAQAGALSPFTVSISRGDGTQPLGQITARLPRGLLGYVSSVSPCGAADAQRGTCPAASRIGVVSATAGAGPEPLTVPGTAYLARGSGGYPFALSVVVPAVAGPFELGNVVVLVNLQVNSDGSITAASAPLPSILDGIPLDIRTVSLTIDRPGFTFNPTSCNPLALSGTVTSVAGVVAPISGPFQASGCAELPFAPSFTTATQGSTSKANGASLTVRVSQKPGEADIRSVHVELPKQLPSRLTTLQKACTETQFDTNPAGCPPGSDIGTATAITPTLSSPLTGPAFLVSHGAAAFPDLELILQGEGVTVILDGATDIKKGVTSSTFASVPDVPISGFQLSLPEGPYSALAANARLCEQRLLMPTVITGQNGIVVRQGTRIAVAGCPKLKIISVKVKSATATVTVQVPGAGRLAVSGPRLRHASRIVRHAGVSTLEIRPSGQGLASASSGRPRKVKLTASFKPSGGAGSSVSTNVTFR